MKEAILSDSLMNKLADMGIKAADFAEKSAQNIYLFIEKEAPLLLHEWVLWNLWKHLIPTIICFIMLLSIGFNFKSIRNYDGSLDKADRGTALFATFIVCVVLIVVILFNIEWIKILVAPRIWILENIKELIR